MLEAPSTTGWKSPSPFSAVLVEGFRSADPPMRLWTRFASPFITSPPATRVAIALSPAFHFGTSAAHPPAASRRRTTRIPPLPSETLRGKHRTSRLPFRLHPRPRHLGLAEIRDRFIGQIEFLFRRPSQRLLRRQQLFFAERTSVRGKIVVFLRAAKADVRPDQQQRRPFRIQLRPLDRVGNFSRIVAVFHVDRLPSIRVEPPANVFRERQIGAPPASVIRLLS
jgi:hypothetical protein